MAQEPPVAKPRERVSEARPKDRFRSDASEQAVQACYDLLSSGHSLSKMLVALKQLGPLNKAKSELVDAPGDPQISHLPMRLPRHLNRKSSRLRNRPK